MDKETLQPEESEKRKELHNVQLTWGSLNELESVYVNQMNVTFTGNEFYVVFGELCMPVIFDAENFPKELIITPKIRLAISPIVMANIVQVLSDYVMKMKAG